MRTCQVFACALLVVLTALPARAADIGTAFTYQGFLEKPAGTPVNDTCTLEFKLCDDAEAACEPGTISNHPGVVVTDGVFTVANVDFGAGAFTGEARWLVVYVQCTGDGGLVALSPRVELTPAPYALRATEGVGPPGVLNVTSEGNVGIGTASPTQKLDVAGIIQAAEGVTVGNTIKVCSPGIPSTLRYISSDGEMDLYVDHPNPASGSTPCPANPTGDGADRALRLEKGGTSAAEVNLIGGHVANSVTFPVDGATIGGGGSAGSPNRVTDDFGTVGGGESNRAGDNAAPMSDASHATVSGGYGNTASGFLATVSGGNGNTASGDESTVSGGFTNTASGPGATISGGAFNTAVGIEANIGGGTSNTASGYSSAVGGGESNTASLSHSTVGGGFINTASGDFSTVVGGQFNRATHPHSTVGGGLSNEATQANATVSGGESNIATRAHSTVGGGFSNEATNNYATVGGGEDNWALGDRSTVGGGRSNFAGNTYATIAGGSGNNAPAYWSTVPGGSSNQAGGDFSFAAGRLATVRTGPGVGGGDPDGDQGTFVWADSTATNFISTGPNQFLIRASGGVGIGTTSPTATLHIAGTTFGVGVRAIGTSRGVFGSGSDDGVYGEGGFNGVQGYAPGPNGNGVVGMCHPGTDSWGVVGASTDGQGVVGRSGPPPLPGGGYPPETGVVGHSSSANGYGVYGEAANPVAANALPTDIAGFFKGKLAATNLPAGSYFMVDWDPVTGLFHNSGSSSRRFKENITPLQDDFERLLDAQPMTYTRPGGPDQWEIGWIAEDFQDLGLTHLTLYDQEHRPDGINYQRICVYLTEIAKTQAKKIESLEAENAEIKSRLGRQEQLEARLEKLEAIVKALTSHNIGGGR